MFRLSKAEFARIFGKKGCHNLKSATTKYQNQKCWYKGIEFDSIHECDRYIVLDDLYRRRLISDLRTQVRFELIPARIENGKVIERACSYVADFVYVKNGKTVVEDAKSEITRKNQAYIIKRKLMWDKYRIEIQEV